MKLVVDSTVLSEAVTWVHKATDKRPLHPVMGGIVLDASNGVLTLSAQSMATSNTEQVVAEIETDGRVIVSGDRLMAFTKSFHRGKPVAIDVSDAGMNLQCGRSLFNLTVMEDENYPDLPVFPGKVATINGQDFANALSRVSPAVSTDDANPLIMNVRLVATDGVLGLYATDKYRLTECLMDWDGDDAAFTLAPDALQSITTAGSVNVFADESIVGFEYGSRRSTVLQKAGEFPNIQKLLQNFFPNDSTDVNVLVSTNEFIECANRAGLSSGKGINGGKDSLRMITNSQGMTIEANDDGVSSGIEYLPATLTGAKEYAASFNPKFLGDALRCINAEKVNLAVSKPGGPVKFTPVGTDDYQHVVMPVRD